MVLSIPSRCVSATSVIGEDSCDFWTLKDAFDSWRNRKMKSLSRTSLMCAMRASCDWLTRVCSSLDVSTAAPVDVGDCWAPPCEHDSMFSRRSRGKISSDDCRWHRDFVAICWLISWPEQSRASKDNVWTTAARDSADFRLRLFTFNVWLVSTEINENFDISQCYLRFLCCIHDFAITRLLMFNSQLLLSINFTCKQF